MTIFRPIYSLQLSGITYFRVQRRFLLMQLPSLVPAFKAHFLFRICRPLLANKKNCLIDDSHVKKHLCYLCCKFYQEDTTDIEGLKANCKHTKSYSSAHVWA